MDQTIIHLHGTSEYIVGKNKTLTVVVLFDGRKNYDEHVNVRLAASGATATILGVVVGKNNTVHSLHTVQHHESPETTSDLLIKSVLSDASQFSYNGGIIVDKHAQKTNAYQRNENLLLSEGAHVESNPRLEILANDVRCTHGATMGPINEEELWYLQSRGINRNNAEILIAGGFLQHVVDRLDDESVRQKILRWVQKEVYG